MSIVSKSFGPFTLDVNKITTVPSKKSYIYIKYTKEHLHRDARLQAQEAQSWENS